MCRLAGHHLLDMLRSPETMNRVTLLISRKTAGDAWAPCMSSVSAGAQIINKKPWTTTNGHCAHCKPRYKHLNSGFVYQPGK